VQHLSYALFLAMRQRLVVVSACSRFGAVYQGIATARSACLWCAYGSMSLQPAVDESSTLIHQSAWKNLYENVKLQDGSRRWFRRAASPTQH
jgi:hypothetical protein